MRRDTTTSQLEAAHRVSQDELGGSEARQGTRRREKLLARHRLANHAIEKKLPAVERI
jgi:hypothetical protein